MQRKSLGRTLIVWTILFSSFITIILTGLQLYNDFRNDVNNIKVTLNEIELSMLGTLSSNLWLDDKDEIKIALSGIVATPNINYAAIRVNDTVYSSSGKFLEQNVIVKAVALEYKYNDKIHSIGELYTQADITQVYSKLINKFWVILASNALKTALVAVFMFLMVNALIIKRLEKISSFIRSPDNPDFSNRIENLEKKKDKVNDEIDEIVQSVNIKQSELEKYFNQLKETQIELLKAKEKAEAANEAKSQFLSRMSHEFRTPLNAILGFSQIIQLDAELSKRHQESVNEILVAGEHMLALVDEILDISRIEAGKLECVPKNCNLNKMLDDCVNNIKPLSNEKNIELQIAYKNDTDQEIYVDPVRFKQVILNLLTNAIKYNKEGGKVTLNYEPVKDELIKISITDTGVGISNRDQERLFQPFERVGGHEGIDGTGIGLSICKNIVEMMGGEIGVKSEEGKGSTFWITVKATK